jgi:hypothetical protein
MKNLYFLVFLSFICTASSGQSMYEPCPLIKKDSLRFKVIEQTADQQLLEYKDRSSRQKKYIKEVFSKRKDFFKESIEKGSFLISSPIEQHCKNLLQLILNSNSQLDKNIQLFISKNEEPNAFNTGDGNLVINIGLLSKIENDAQLTFIICHELSHQHLNHVNKMMIKKAEKYTDEEYLRAVKKTAKEKYNVRDKIEQLVLPMIFDDRKYSRTEEFEADSLGFVFFLKTGFDAAEAINCLALLKSIDKYYDIKPLDLTEYFKSKQIEAKSYWFTGLHVSSLGIEIEKDSLEDSLKTHPETELRIKALENPVKSAAATGKKYFSVETDFDAFRMQTIHELIFSNLIHGNLSRTLLESFITSRDHPEDVFSQVILSLCFSRLYHLQSTHRVQTEVDLPDPKYYDDCYNTLIGFINQVKKDDALMLSGKFFPAAKYQNSEIYLATAIYHAYVTKDESFASMKSDYLKTYPKGWFFEFFNSIKL